MDAASSPCPPPLQQWLGPYTYDTYQNSSCTDYTALARCPVLLTPPATRAWNQSYVNSHGEDTAPESAAVIPADVSPSGYPLLVAAYEESNTVAVFELKFDE